MRILFFTGPNCKACVAMKPVVARVAERIGIEVDELDVSTETGGKIAQALGVRSLPTTVLADCGDNPFIVSGWRIFESVNGAVAEKRLREIVRGLR